MQVGLLRTIRVLPQRPDKREVRGSTPRWPVRDDASACRLQVGLRDICRAPLKPGSGIPTDDAIAPLNGSLDGRYTIALVIGSRVATHRGESGPSCRGRRVRPRLRVWTVNVSTAGFRNVTTARSSIVITASPMFARLIWRQAREGRSPSRTSRTSSVPSIVESRSCAGDRSLA